MTKEEFLAQLRHKLRTMPKEDIQDAVDYYDSYITDAETDEVNVIQHLGSPGEIAAQILADFAVSPPAGHKTPPRGLGIAWSIILAIFALPIGLPVALAIALTALALLVVLLSSLFAFFVSAAALIASGVFCVLVLPLVLIKSIPLAVTVLGQGLFGIGIGILLLKFSRWLFRGGSQFIARFVGKRIVRRRVNG